MFFADYRARKKAEKRKQDFMAMKYPPGYSTEPKRQPNPDYKLQTTKEELVQCLMVYDNLPKDDAEEQATNMLQWLPTTLRENLDEAVQRKPLSNIVIDGLLTLYECMEFFYLDRVLSSVYFSIYYLSAEAAGILLSPKDIVEMREKALKEG